MSASRREGKRRYSCGFKSKLSSRSSYTSLVLVPPPPTPGPSTPPSFPSLSQHGLVLLASARLWTLSHLRLPPVEMDAVGLGNNLEATLVPLPALISY